MSPNNGWDFHNHQRRGIQEANQQSTHQNKSNWNWWLPADDAFDLPKGCPIIEQTVRGVDSHQSARHHQHPFDDNDIRACYTSNIINYTLIASIAVEILLHGKIVDWHNLPIRINIWNPTSWHHLVVLFGFLIDRLIRILIIHGSIFNLQHHALYNHKNNKLQQDIIIKQKYYRSKFGFGKHTSSLWIIMGQP